MANTNLGSTGSGTKKKKQNVNRAQATSQAASKPSSNVALGGTQQSQADERAFNLHRAYEADNAAYQAARDRANAAQGGTQQNQAYNRAVDGAIQMLQANTAGTAQGGAQQNTLQTSGDNNVMMQGLKEVVSNLQKNLANQAAQAQQDTAATTQDGYQSPYAGTIQQTLDKLLNGEDFSYDFNADPLYQQARDNYRAMGQTAMLDTMGQAAALSGGYGNSYATTAAQQAYQQAAGQVNDIIPELQAAAYDRYRNEIADTKDTLSILQGLENAAYDRYWNNKVFDRDVYESDRAYDRGVYESDRDYNRGVLESDRNYELTKADTEHGWKQDEINNNFRDRELTETEKQNDINNTFREKTFDYGKEQDAQAAALQAAQLRASDLSGNLQGYINAGVDSILAGGGGYYQIMDYLGPLVESGLISSAEMDAIAGNYIDVVGNDGGMEATDAQTMFERLITAGYSSAEAREYLTRLGYL